MYVNYKKISVNGRATLQFNILPEILVRQLELVPVSE